MPQGSDWTTYMKLQQKTHMLFSFSFLFTSDRFLSLVTNYKTMNYKNYDSILIYNIHVKIKNNLNFLTSSHHLLTTKTVLATHLCIIVKILIYVLAREGLLKYCAPSGYNPETDGHTEWTGPGLCTLMGSRASSILPEPKQLIEGCAAHVKGD